MTLFETTFSGALAPVRRWDQVFNLDRNVKKIAMNKGTIKVPQRSFSYI
jgi:hypothetical protein